MPRIFFVLLCLAGSLQVLSPARAAPTPARAVATPGEQYAAFVQRACDQTEARMPEITKLAELVALRHINGGTLGVIWEPPSATGPQGPQYELKGRSGGMTAFDVNLTKILPTASREKDVAIIGWQRAPGTGDLDILRRYHEKYFVIAFGPRALPELAEHVKLADAWIDTGLGTDDSVVALPNGTRAGRGNALVNVLNSWAFIGELVAACTRRGKMPTMLKSHMWDDSKEWNGRYRQKLLFHDDITVPPIAPGTLARRYLAQVRLLAGKLQATQAPAITTMAKLIVAELASGRKTLVAQTGHTTYESVGQYEDKVWAIPTVLYDTPGRVKQWPETTPDKALVLRVGYSGEDKKLLDLLRQKEQRVLLIATAGDHRPDYKIQADGVAAFIDMGWDFGDACVEIEGYPIRVFPPSGASQLIAYEMVNLEVLAALPSPAK